MKNMEFGDFESFLLSNKKQIINDFYEMNLAEIKAQTGAKEVSCVKSGIIVLIASMVAYIAYNCQLPVLDILRLILLNSAYITIGSVAIVNLIKSIELIFYSVVSRKNAKKQFELILSMASKFKADLENGKVPDFIALLSDSSGNIASIIFNNNQKSPIAKCAEYINIHLPNGDILVLERDDFVNRLISLDEHMIYNPYDGSDEDELQLQEIIKAYAKAQAGQIESDEHLRLNELLTQLEDKVLLKTRFGNNFSEEGPRRTLRNEDNQ
ncbi:MAG: hypothetical protein IJO63_03165 [Bacilli bacterium]|nr:hypothetical protein [Bacilli bacterium]